METMRARPRRRLQGACWIRSGFANDGHFEAWRSAGGRSEATALASTWLASLPQLRRTNVTTSATCSSERLQANEGIANCAGVDAVRGVVAPSSTTETTESGFVARTTALPASGG